VSSAVPVPSPCPTWAASRQCRDGYGSARRGSSPRVRRGQYGWGVREVRPSHTQLPGVAKTHAGRGKWFAPWSGVGCIAVDGGGAGLPSPEGYDLDLTLGSDWSVYGPQVAAHVNREVELRRSAVGQDIPVLGICFGGQLLARALGGTVERSPEPEIGWYPIDT